jgi:formylglycine-generating enzyme
MKHTKYLLFFVLVVILLLSCTKKTTEPDQTVSTPFFTPAGGTYTSPQTVTISSETLGVTILYTTDGSNPTSSSAVYTNPIQITETTTLRAKAFRTGWTDSQTASAAYTIILPQGFIYVPGGTFTMGDTRGVGYSDELPTHTVTLNSFYMGRYEVTQAEYSQYMQPGASLTSTFGLGDNYPAYYVSWYAILKYCNLRSMAEGLTPVYTISGSTNPANWGAVPNSNNATWNAAICNWSANGYRLPTEAEWEYAARGATNNPDYLYAGSDDFNAVAWYDGNNTHNGSNPVGGKAPNGLGLYDMSGNLWEWCWDWWSSSYYSVSPVNNPTGPASGSYRLLRGGGWYGYAGYCRVTYRYYSYPYSSRFSSGFRIVRAN